MEPNAYPNFRGVNQKLGSLLDMEYLPGPLRRGEIRYMYHLTSKLLGKDDSLYEDFGIDILSKNFRKPLPCNRNEAERIAKQIIANSHPQLLDRETLEMFAKKLLNEIYGGRTSESTEDARQSRFVDQNRTEPEQTTGISTVSRITTSPVDSEAMAVDKPKKAKPGKLFD